PATPDGGPEPARVPVRARRRELLPPLAGGRAHDRAVTPPLRVDVGDGVAVVTLDDPDRRNALSGPMVEAIVAAFDQLEGRDDVGAVVVTGAPPAFCAGADLSSL